MSTDTFYGIVAFCEVEKNAGTSFLGVYRMELGWCCKQINTGKTIYKDDTPAQLHEFLDKIGKNRFEFMNYEQARKRVLGVGV